MLVVGQWAALGARFAQDARARLMAGKVGVEAREHDREKDHDRRDSDEQGSGGNE
jgi:hypothetical protein